jgi:hypothetical protein
MSQEHFLRAHALHQFREAAFTDRDFKFTDSNLVISD